MPITLFAVSYKQGPVTPKLTACFGPDGGTIGRADHNTLVLADPDRHISRLQAEVVPSGDGFVIRNVGSAKPIVVGERTLPSGSFAQLDHGLKVSIGAYVLEVDALGSSALQTASAEINDPAVASAAPAQAVSTERVTPPLVSTDPEPTAASPLDQGVPGLGASAGTDVEATLHLRQQDGPANDDQSAQRLWAAFCEGAGVQLPLLEGTGPEKMRQVGSLLRTAVDGTLRMMSVRSRVKTEFGTDVTVIGRHDNNPLKFSPNASVGLSHLLQPPVQGFLPGLTAMEDAMQDLVGHSEASWAGMRAAIEGTVKQLSPGMLQAQSLKGLALGTLLPVTRKAKLWDGYLEHHLQVQNQVNHDLPSLCGKAFAAAYQKALEEANSKAPD